MRRYAQVETGALATLATLVALGLALAAIEVVSAAPGAGFSLALHGHYCGLNHGDGSYETQPVDVLDAACMAHDKCYDLHYLDCRFVFVSSLLLLLLIALARVFL